MRLKLSKIINYKNLAKPEEVTYHRKKFYGFKSNVAFYLLTEKDNQFRFLCLDGAYIWTENSDFDTFQSAIDQYCEEYIIIEFDTLGEFAQWIMEESE